MTLKRLFVERTHYVFSTLAVSLILSGLLLMTGEGSSNDTFCPDIFSARRITLAPLLCLAGYLLLITAILWRRNTRRWAIAKRMMNFCCRINTALLIRQQRSVDSTTKTCPH